MSEQNVHHHWITSTGREGCVGSAEARFPYWSFTKTVIAVSALKLVEAGTLNLDAPFKEQAYSLRQLFAHTAGLPDYGQLAEYHAAVAAEEAPWSRKKLLDKALKKELLFEPGDGWAYSNIGYMFVRELIEEVTAKPLGTYVAELICEPLGLRSIELAETGELFAELHWDGATGYDPRWVYHGCLIGTASDAAALLHALFAGALLRPDSLALMCDRRVLGGPLPGRPWTECGYGLGLMAGPMERAGVAIGHSGAGPFCVNAVYHFPDAPDPITVACFTEGTNEGIAEFAAKALALEQ